MIQPFIMHPCIQAFDPTHILYMLVDTIYKKKDNTSQMPYNLDIPEKGMFPFKLV